MGAFRYAGGSAGEGTRYLPAGSQQTRSQQEPPSLREKRASHVEAALEDVVARSPPYSAYLER